MSAYQACSRAWRASIDVGDAAGTTCATWTSPSSVAMPIAWVIARWPTSVKSVPTTTTRGRRKVGLGADTSGGTHATLTGAARSTPRATDPYQSCSMME